MPPPPPPVTTVSTATATSTTHGDYDYAHGGGCDYDDDHADGDCLSPGPPLPTSSSHYLGHAQREHVPSRGVRGVKKHGSNLQSATLPRKAKFREHHQQQHPSVVREYNPNIDSFRVIF